MGRTSATADDESTAPSATTPLQELRLAVGSTQTAFARSVGMKQSNLSMSERGLKPLAGAAALRIADTHREVMLRLGVTVEDLIRGTRAR